MTLQWKPGVSGNPNGRQAKIPDNVIRMFTNNAEKAIRRLYELMNNPDANIRLNAVKYFLDKGLGRNFQAFQKIDEADEDATFTIRVVRASRQENISGKKT